MTIACDTDLTEALYGLAVQREGITCGDAARELDVRPREVAMAAGSLIERGLLVTRPDEADFLVPVIPMAAHTRHMAKLMSDIERCQREYAAIQEHLWRYVEIHEAAVARIDRTSPLQRLIGLPLIHEEIRRAAAGCRTDVLAALPGGRISDALDATWRDSTSLVERGVRVRTIYDHSARFTAGARPHVAQTVATGGEVRTAIGSFEPMLVIDRETAFVPARADHQIAVLVREPALVAFLVGTFERLWEASSPFPGGRTTAADRRQMISEVRLAIIRLLAEGYTDEAVAKRIGLSIRACRGHIAAIYEYFGAQSRFQLGILVARSGLLDADAAVTVDGTPDRRGAWLPGRAMSSSKAPSLKNPSAAA